jgi:hypothetical protein
LARSSADHLRNRGLSTDDQGMAKLDIPCVGGPVDGRVADVDVNDDGLPPDVLPESWLWPAYGSELLDADLDGRYELEPVAGFGPPWLYVWAPRGAARQDAGAV